MEGDLARKRVGVALGEVAGVDRREVGFRGSLAQPLEELRPPAAQHLHDGVVQRLADAERDTSSR